MAPRINLSNFHADPQLPRVRWVSLCGRRVRRRITMHIGGRRLTKAIPCRMVWIETWSDGRIMKRQPVTADDENGRGDAGFEVPASMIGQWRAPLDRGLESARLPF